ncbi:MAG TPA: cytidine deaminase [Candidatus Eisenbacteria bacterium]
MSDISVEALGQLRLAAWRARDHARTYSGIKVGAAVLTAAGEVFAGCNLEHRFRAHDIHAETNAIGSFVAGSVSTVVAVLVASEEALFTPCGGCMDWIFEHGGADCVVYVMSSRDTAPMTWRASELMPHYPHQ